MHEEWYIQIPKWCMAVFYRHRDVSQAELASPSFIWAWFISSQPVSVRKTLARHKASWGMVFGKRTGTGLSLGIHGDVWRSTEQSCGSESEKPLESLCTLRHRRETDLVGDAGAWKLTHQAEAAGWVSTSPPTWSVVGVRGDPETVAMLSRGRGANHQPQPHGTVLKSQILEITTAAGRESWPRPSWPKVGATHLCHEEQDPGACWCYSISLMYSLAFAMGGRDPWPGTLNSEARPGHWGTPVSGAGILGREMPLEPGSGPTRTYKRGAAPVPAWAALIQKCSRTNGI